MRFLLITLGICFAVNFAQPVFSQHKDSRDATIWPQWQVRYITENENLIFFQNQYRINSNSDFNKVGFAERIQFRLGYEHGFTEHWRAGLSERYAHENSRDVLFSEIYITHVGKIKSVNFTKRLSFEHLLEKQRDNSGRFRFFVQLDKAFEVKSWKLAPAVSAELFVYKFFKDTDFYERTIDRARLRAALAISPSKAITITPYFTRQVDYFVFEPRFDMAGNEVSPGGNWNINTPIFGIDLMYTFSKSQETSTHQNQLRNR